MKINQTIKERFNEYQVLINRKLNGEFRNTITLSIIVLILCIILLVANLYISYKELSDSHNDLKQDYIEYKVESITRISNIEKNYDSVLALNEVLTNENDSLKNAIAEVKPVKAKKLVFYKVNNGVRVFDVKLLTSYLRKYVKTNNISYNIGGTAYKPSNYKINYLMLNVVY